MDFIGNKLRKIREDRTWTMQDLVEMSGIRQATISDIETGKIQPRKATVLKLCELFKIDELYFYLPSSELLTDVLPGMPDNLKEFVMDSQNTVYIAVSEKAKEYGISPESLEKLIEVCREQKK